MRYLHQIRLKPKYDYANLFLHRRREKKIVGKQINLA